MSSNYSILMRLRLIDFYKIFSYCMQEGFTSSVLSLFLLLELLVCCSFALVHIGSPVTQWWNASARAGDGLALRFQFRANKTLLMHTHRTDTYTSHNLQARTHTQKWPLPIVRFNDTTQTPLDSVQAKAIIFLYPVSFHLLNLFFFLKFCK